MIFQDRHDAGRQLARKLDPWRGEDSVILGLPRGGVPVAYEVAQALHAPLDVFIVRKLGVPGHEELALGAIASGGVRVLNHDVIEIYQITPEIIDAVTSHETEKLAAYERDYRGDLPPPEVAGRTAVLVDDGLATGSTMRAAIAALRRLKPRRIYVAVPVGAAATCGDLAFLADHLVCLFSPESFQAVGNWYHDFSQTSDEEVRSLLRLAAR